MAKIKFKSGEVYEFSGSVSIYEAASALGIISRDVITARLNGSLCELSTSVESDAEVELLTFKDEDGKLIWECPNCKNRDQEKMNVARRTCGYIGTQFWNQGRTQEIKERVLHL